MQVLYMRRWVSPGAVCDFRGYLEASIEAVLIPRVCALRERCVVSVFQETVGESVTKGAKVVEWSRDPRTCPMLAYDP